jgi:membrane protein involved in colicin uptake
MITMLMGFGLSSRIAKLIAYVAIPLLILAAFVAVILLYGNAREKAGHAKADAEWQAASDKLVQDAAKAGTKADAKAAARAADFAAKQENEKERIHDALEEGRSPFDELFPANGM